MARIADTRPLRHITPRRAASPLTVAVVMTAVTAALVASIASIFIYSSGSRLTQTAAAPLPPPAIYEKTPAETTGSSASK
jgi:hypothetical protein